MKCGYVYILTNRKEGTLYIGVTSDIERRMAEHKTGIFGGFSAKYNLHKLVYLESYERIDEAIYREKCMKEWKRAWKIKRIEEMNPDWLDLSDDMGVGGRSRPSSG